MIAPEPSFDVQALEAEIRADAAEIHARTARLAARLAFFDELYGWGGTGMRDCADWVTCHLGFNPQNAKALMVAGHAARELPEVGEAFSAGEISVDKIRLLAPVVTTEDEGTWVEIARGSSSAELARRCREHRSAQTTGPERDRAQRARRRLHTWYDAENIFRISGALPTDEGAMVQIAIDRAKQALRAMREKQHIVIDLDPADDPLHAEQADALVWLCSEAVLREPRTTDRVPCLPVQMLVHVDYDVLTGANPDGRGHIEDGPALSTPTLRRLGCDATVKTLIERDGEVIATGREKRIVPPGMKLKMQCRDRICVFPGCPRPASRCEAHHLDHWADRGPTELWNLAALCEGHHDRHHDGEFDIHRTPEGDLRFVGRDGRELGTVTGGHWKRPRTRAGP